MKTFFIGVFICNFSFTAMAQLPEMVDIVSKLKPLETSFYNDVEVLDSRTDTLTIGFFLKGAFVRRSPIQLDTNFKAEIRAVALSVLPRLNANHNKLLFLIRNLNYSELATKGRDTSLLTFKVYCYLQKDERYYPLFKIDTIIATKRFDIYKLSSAISAQIDFLVQKAANYQGVDSIFFKKAYWTNTQILDVNNIEKSNLPVYKVLVPARGIYFSYDEFKKNKPSVINIEWTYNKEQPVIYMIDSLGAAKELSVKSVYAVSNGIKAYISFKNEYHLLTKRNGDFHFSSNIDHDRNLQNFVLGNASSAANLPAFKIVNAPEYDCIIDYATGMSIPLRKMIHKPAGL